MFYLLRMKVSKFEILIHFLEFQKFETSNSANLSQIQIMNM